MSITVEQKLKGMLTSKGMSEEQAESVMQIAKPRLNDTLGNYNITFDSRSDEYPDVIYNVLMMSIDPIALKWIEENKPMAWFKPMFQQQ